MNYLLKSQLIQIVKNLAYTAYGFNVNIPYQKVPLVLNKSYPQYNYYKISIPQLIYEQYRKDGFIYSDPGITPKQIADDILVHFRSKQHIQMDSDQFGNIIGFIKQKYFQQTFQNIIKSNKISLLNCKEYEFYLNQNKEKNKTSQFQSQNKLNIYVNYVNSKKYLTLTQLRQKYYSDILRKIDYQILQKKSQVVSFQNQLDQIQMIRQVENIKNKNNRLLNNEDINFKILCARHQLLKRQIQMENIHKTFNKKDTIINQTFDKNFIKFGIVYPQQFKIQSLLSTLSKEQLKKLQNIFLSYPTQYPINLTDQKMSSNLQKCQLLIQKDIQKSYPNSFLTQQKLNKLKIIYESSTTSEDSKLLIHEMNKFLLLIYQFLNQGNISKIYYSLNYLNKFTQFIQQIQTMEDGKRIQRQQVLRCAKILKNHLFHILEFIKQI